MNEKRADSWSHREAIVNAGGRTGSERNADGVRLHYVETGPESGPLVVLLHGFPEFWYSWRHQLDALGDAGYRVVAPDMRGYNRSEKPRGVGAYRLEHLTGDVAALVDHLGAERAHVVGHDWGGVVAWALGMHRPEAVDRLAVLNAPHPYALVRNASLAQALRSWYVFLFQLPWLPEALLRAGDFAAVERGLRDGPAHPDAFSEADVRRYKAALARPGALTSALDYYRAFARYDFSGYVRDALSGGGQPVSVAAPTLLLWGERDPALGVELIDGLDRWVPDIRVRRFADASHWVQADAPKRVNEGLCAFLG